MGSRQLTEDLLEQIVAGVEAVSEEFERWGEPYVRGPGLYIVIADGPIADFADPIGDNHWPVEECSTVTDDFERFVETATAVGTTRDGAIVVRENGEIQRQMVRLHDLRSIDTNGDAPPSVVYQDWMGARHMSAVETSAHRDVVATVTLSEEDGRVSVFVDGHEAELPG